MDFFFIVLLVALLLMFGYAQLQKGIVKTPGKITLREQDDTGPMESRM